MSNIDMVCPLCHVELEIPAEFDGQKVKCPSCSKDITVSDPRIARETSKKTFRINRTATQPYEAPSVPVLQKTGLPMPVILGLVLLMFVTIGVSITAIVMVLKNKPFTVEKAISSNIVETIARQDSSVAIPNNNPIVPKAKTSILTINVTFKYNDFVGYKPDVGAHVLLRPKNNKVKLVINILGIYSALDEIKKEGFFLEEVNGFGKAIIRKIPPGDYTCIIESKNSQCCDPAHKDWRKTTVDMMSNYFEGELERALEMRKIEFKHLTIEENEDPEISVDFPSSC